jgi:hypothetical protein
MLSEALPHARLEDREIPLGMQPPAVDDADAAIVVVTIVDEPLQARDRFRGGLTMQIEPAAWGVLSTLQFSELTPVHTWSNEARLRNVMIVFTARRQPRRRGRARSGGLRSSANAPARVRREPDDVRHRAREVLDFSIRNVGLVALVVAFGLPGAPLHSAIVLAAESGVTGEFERNPARVAPPVDSHLRRWGAASSRTLPPVAIRVPAECSSMIECRSPASRTTVRSPGR